MAHKLAVGDILKAVESFKYTQRVSNGWSNIADPGFLLFLEKLDQYPQCWDIQVIHNQAKMYITAERLERLLNDGKLQYFTKALSPELFVTGMITNSPTCTNCEPENCTDAACAEAEHGEPINNGEREICYWCQGPTKDLCGGRARWCVKCKK